MNTSVAIQIVNYNTKQYLEKLLEDIFSDIESSPIDYSVLVLENNSDDNLADLEERHKNKPIQFFYNNKNVGFGAGHNILAKKSDTAFVFILNPDIRFAQPETIERLLQKAADKTVAVVGPKFITVKGKTQKWDHGELAGFRAWVANKAGGSFWRDRTAPTSVAWVSGAAFLIKRDVFNAVDGFDENFFLYKEEEDLCLRIRERGGKIVYDPTVKMLHYGSVVASKDRHMQQSKDYFLKKHFKHKTGYFLFKIIHRLLPN